MVSFSRTPIQRVSPADASSSPRRKAYVGGGRSSNRGGSSHGTGVVTLGGRSHSDHYANRGAHTGVYASIGLGGRHGHNGLAFGYERHRDGDHGYHHGRIKSLHDDHHTSYRRSYGHHSPHYGYGHYDGFPYRRNHGHYEVVYYSAYRNADYYGYGSNFGYSPYLSGRYSSFGFGSAFSYPSEPANYTTIYTTEPVIENYYDYDDGVDSTSTQGYQRASVPGVAYSREAVDAPVAQIVIPEEDALPGDLEQDDRDNTLVFGHGAFVAGRYEEARSYYLQAILNDTDDSFAKLFYSLANIAVGDYGPAYQSLREALSINHELIDNPIDLRQFYADRETLDGHKTRLSVAIQGAVDASEEQFLLSYLYFSTGDPQNASDWLNRFMELAPSDDISLALKGSMGRILQATQAKP